MIIASMLVAPVLGLNTIIAGASSETTMDSITFDEEGAKNRPVSKVIKLLKDMHKQMEKEGQEDEEAYDKMKCWCITNDKEKSQSIADAEAQVADLTSKIEKYTALSAQTTTEIKNLNSEKAADIAALAQATALRQKQLTEFNGEEKDMLQSISSLTSANTILAKKKGAMVQMPKSVQHLMEKHQSLLSSIMTHSQRNAVTALIQAPGYAKQGGEIFGILSQMKETFETNLATTQTEEASNQKAFDGLKAAKEGEIQAGQDMLDEKTKLLADTDESNAQAAQDKVNTKNALSSDGEFLAALKEKCTLTDSEWAERQKTRGQEMGAVQKALGVLTNDDAHDLLSKSLGFVQTDSSLHSDRRMQASKIIEAVAEKTQNPKLAILAVSVKINAFVKVKKAIDGMVVALMREKDDEIKHKDFCLEEFQSNELKTEKKLRGKKDEVVEIKGLSIGIASLQGQVKKLRAEIAELNKQLKIQGEDREKDNKAFQLTVTDQRATQKLLKSALSALGGFYKKEAAAAAMMQQAQLATGGPPPPPGFDSYKKNSAAGGVTSMLQQIINDAKALEAEAIRAEQEGQKTYEATVIQTNTAIEAKNASILDKSSVMLDKQGLESTDQKDLAAINLELEQLATQKADLHVSCDYVMKNFDIRQQARDEEVDALKQAKSILSGAKFDAFLQGR